MILWCVLLSVTPLMSAFSSTEVKRTITKSFQVSPESEMIIENSYGSIIIAEWDKQEIYFSIEITGKGKDQSTAEEMAERVSVDFEQKGNKVSAKTVFASMNSKCNNCGTTVDYVVNVPSRIYMNLTNKYGSIKFDRALLNFKADVKYGNLSATSLQGQNNNINIKYGNLNVEHITQLKLDLGYGKANIVKADNLELQSAYSTFAITETGNFKLTSKYDKFTIDRLGSLSASSAYSDFNIGTLMEKFDVAEIKYGKLKINQVATDFQLIRMNASYVNIYINLTKQHSFKADLSVKYGKIQTKDLTFSNVSFNDSDSSNSKSLNGIAGADTNTSATVRISNRYGDIVFGN